MIGMWTEYDRERHELDNQDRLERERDLERVAEMAPAPPLLAAPGRTADPLSPRRVEIAAVLAEAWDELEEGNCQTAQELVGHAQELVVDCEPAGTHRAIRVEDFLAVTPAQERAREAVRAVLRRHDSELGASGDWDFSTELLDAVIAAAQTAI